MLIEQIFVFESTRSRQRQAPLLKERELFLQYMLDQGIGRSHTRTVAAMLLNVVRVLHLTSLRVVSVQELEIAAQRWLSDGGSRRTKATGKCCTDTFAYSAARWLTFLGVLERPQVALTPAEVIIRDFGDHLRARNLCQESVRATTARALQFLKWALERCGTLSAICLKEVDEYLEMKRASGCLPRSIIGICYALRSLFRYAEARNLNGQRIAPGIANPKISRFDTPLGPAWRDVRRVLNCGFGDSPSELRASAIFSLCSIYALRRCEVVNLKLSDFNWISETLTVRRAKSGRIQQFPLRFEVGERILRYLQAGRPRCNLQTVFVSVHSPHRQIDPTTVWAIIGPRL
jgi:site-specific recombinase XerD